VIARANGCLPHNKLRLPYISSPKTYTPDFLLPVGDRKFLLIECKGLLTSEERTKYKAVQNCYPTIAAKLGTDFVELVFIFQNSKGKLNPKNPNSKTYGEWATSEGFRWTDSPYFPDEWFQDDLYTSVEIA
jgi:hypothetical protein